MTAWARAGAKVVCIDSSIPMMSGYEDFDVPDLVKGQVYTVRDVEASYGTLWFSLEGCSVDDQYEIVHFRPLVAPSQEQDLAHFVPLLKTKELV